jgi:hypothetical protein
LAQPFLKTRVDNRKFELDGRVELNVIGVDVHAAYQVVGCQLVPEGGWRRRSRNSREETG